MLTTPFLTDIDPQAAIKGSRDPLGVQPLWSRMGRYLVGNLTTVTTSVRGFTTLMLGYYFGERVANEESEGDELGVFLRWEQLAAYARGYVNGDWDFLGVRRVKRTLSESNTVRLSVDATAQILSNQKTYGLWGLYTIPAKASGLIEGDPSRLTPQARELVETIYLPLFAEAGFRHADSIVARLAKPRTDVDLSGVDKKLLQAVAGVLSGDIRASPERSFYREHLLLGGPHDRTGGKQALLARAFEETFEVTNWELTPDRIRQLAKRARDGSPVGDMVAHGLEQIRTAELLLAPAVRLYSFLLASEGQRLDQIAELVRRQWGRGLPTVDPEAIRLVQGDLRDPSSEAGDTERWIAIAEALRVGDYEHALGRLMEQNQAVMKARGGGAPWADLMDGRVRVRFRDEGAFELPERSALRSLWVHPYFLNSVREIGLAVRG